MCSPMSAAAPLRIRSACWAGAAATIAGADPTGGRSSCAGPRSRPPDRPRGSPPCLGARGRGPRPPSSRHESRTGVRVAGAATVPVAVALASLRERLRMPAPAAAAIACAAPLGAIAATAPRTRSRYVAAGAADMWLFKVSWEIPFDKPDKLRQRLHIDYPIAIDRFLGGGVTPTQRLQRALRRPGRVSLLDKAVTLVYGSGVPPPPLPPPRPARPQRYR